MNAERCFSFSCSRLTCECEDKRRRGEHGTSAPLSLQPFLPVCTMWSRMSEAAIRSNTQSFTSAVALGLLSGRRRSDKMSRPAHVAACPIVSTNNEGGSVVVISHKTCTESRGSRVGSVECVRSLVVVCRGNLKSVVFAVCRQARARRRVSEAASLPHPPYVFPWEQKIIIIQQQLHSSRVNLQCLSTQVCFFFSHLFFFSPPRHLLTSQLCLCVCVGVCVCAGIKGLDEFWMRPLCTVSQNRFKLLEEAVTLVQWVAMICMHHAPN